MGDSVNPLDHDRTPSAETTAENGAELPDEHTRVNPTSRAALDVDSAPAHRLGKYTIDEQVGRGGMGVVWKGFDPDLQRTVAIKVLSEQLAFSPTSRRRFQREARAAAAVNHPNVVTIHSVDEHEGIPYLVMEYVRGRSLKEHLNAKQKFDPLEVIRLGTQISRGLAAAHAQGVVHRDVKPGNVLLDEGTTRAQLTDFGLARVAFDNVDLTSHDQYVGTPAYMAPESLRGERVDTRSDLFSLGCLLYEMLIGYSPFKGRTHGEMIHRILDIDPVRLTDMDATIPDFLSRVIEQLLEKNPDDRIQSAGEVADLFSRLQQDLNQSPTDEMGRIVHNARPQLSRSSGKRWQQVIFVATAAACVFGAAFLWKSGGGTRESPVQLTSESTVTQASDAEATSSTQSAATELDQNSPSDFTNIADGYPWWSFVAIIDETRAVGGGGYYSDEPGEYPLVLWNLDGGTVKRQFAGPESWVWCGDISQDGRHLLASTGPSPIAVNGRRPGGSTSDVFVWDLESGDLLSQFDEHGDTVRAAVFLADGVRAASGGYDGTLRVWSRLTGEELQQLEHPHGEVLALAASPDGKWLAGSHWNGVELWGAENLEWERQFPGEKPLSLGFSHDGRFLAIGRNDGRLQVEDLNASARGEPKEWRGHEGRVSCLVWMPDGRLLSGTDEGHSVRLWDPSESAPVALFGKNGHEVKSLAISGDGRFALAGCAQTGIQRWDLPLGQGD